MDIWQKQAAVSRQLMRWAVASVVAGAAFLAARSRPEHTGIGIQFVVWGAIDGLIAGFGRIGTQRRLNTTPDPAAPAVIERETRNLGRLLWLNALLDVGYVLGGVLLTRREPVEKWRGHGIGVIIQGGFLFFFDLLHALSLKRLKTGD